MQRIESPFNNYDDATAKLSKSALNTVKIEQYKTHRKPPLMTTKSYPAAKKYRFDAYTPAPKAIFIPFSPIQEPPRLKTW